MANRAERRRASSGSRSSRTDRPRPLSKIAARRASPTVSWRATWSNIFRRIWKVGALVAPGGALFATWVTIRPDIKLELASSQDGPTPFSVVFSVTNEGALPAYQVGFVCAERFHLVRGAPPGTSVIYEPSTQAGDNMKLEKRLGSGKVVTKTCPVRLRSSVPVAVGGMSAGILATYKLPLSWFFVQATPLNVEAMVKAGNTIEWRPVSDPDAFGP